MIETPMSKLDQEYEDDKKAEDMLEMAKYEWELSLKELHTAINKVLDDGVEVRQKIIRIMKELRK